MNRKNIYACVVMLIVLAHKVDAQQIFIDQPIEAGDLLVFPHITDSSKYYYLPNKLSLGSNDFRSAAVLVPSLCSKCENKSRIRTSY